MRGYEEVGLEFSGRKGLGKCHYGDFLEQFFKSFCFPACYVNNAV